ncbi:MAG TPA: FAD-dependent oxidoreductase, partial [Desulfatiglandales bacterium]|nr:FAD-dependent oxidoreductase [Desulfatiglandales bacterium]
KDFQRYRDSAEKDKGVRFIRNRIHSIETGKAAGDLKISFSDPEGNRHEEEFDLVVLATGQRPPAGTQDLAEKTGMELNPWGFCKLQDFSLSKTNKEGLFVGGSFSGLRDVSESVIQASSASLEASRLIHSKGGGLFSVKPAAEKAFRDMSKELPHVAVALCSCGDSTSGVVDLEGLSAWAKSQDSVTEVHRVRNLCTQEGWQELRGAMKTSHANRLLVSACMPYLYAPRLKELGEEISLHPRLMEVVDTRTSVLPVADGDRVRVDQDIRMALSMGLSRLKTMDPAPTPTRRIIQRALVVGGGIAGMTAALAIADHGFHVDLVEKGQELGGNLREIYRTIEGSDPQDLLQKTVSRVEKHPNIEVNKGAVVRASRGHAGHFFSVIAKADGTLSTLEHGITILATGGKEATTVSYAYGKSDAVMTQHELEKKLNDGTLDPAKMTTVAMIQCVDSREEPRNYCSRLCCTSALKNALHLKEKNPGLEVYILYRDMMSYGFLETFFTQARRKGVMFIPYEVNSKPKVDLENGRPTLMVRDPILGRDIVVKPDVLALSTGIIPNEGPSLGRLFGVETNQDGFFLEAESKWRPVDFIKEGIFMAGLAHSPRSITESAAMAQAAAQRA